MSNDMRSRQDMFNGCSAIEAEATKRHPSTCICVNCCATNQQEPVGYDAIFNAIGKAVDSGGGDIEISVKAFKAAIGGEIFTTPQPCLRCSEQTK